MRSNEDDDFSEEDTYPKKVGEEIEMYDTYMNLKSSDAYKQHAKEMLEQQIVQHQKQKDRNQTDVKKKSLINNNTNNNFLNIDAIQASKAKGSSHSKCS